MTSKHTQGEWQVVFNGNAAYIGAPGDRNRTVARIEFDAALFDEEDAANARLIAAAPGMLEALEAYLNYYGDAMNDEESAIKERAQSAINKARGEV